MISELLATLMPAADSADAALDSDNGLTVLQHRVSSVTGHPIIGGGSGSIGNIVTVVVGTAGEAKAAGKIPEREATAARVTKADRARNCILALEGGSFERE